MSVGCRIHGWRRPPAADTAQSPHGTGARSHTGVPGLCRASNGAAWQVISDRDARRTSNAIASALKARSSVLSGGLKALLPECNGGQAMHDANLVHLDVKPQNILFERTESDGQAAAAHAHTTMAHQTLISPGLSLQAKLGDFATSLKCSLWDPKVPVSSRNVGGVLSEPCTSRMCTLRCAGRRVSCPPKCSRVSCSVTSCPRWPISAADVHAALHLTNPVPVISPMCQNRIFVLFRAHFSCSHAQTYLSIIHITN